MKRATIAIKMIWNVGERLFKEDFGKRIKMFEALVESVALCAEIWGWKTEERLDKIKRKYVKWTLGLDRRTPNYIIMEETKMKEVKMRAVKTAIKYEEKARKSKKKIVIECIKEMERNRRKEKESKWERKRREVLKEAGVSNEKLREMREKGDRKRNNGENRKERKREEKEENKRIQIQ